MRFPEFTRRSRGPSVPGRPMATKRRRRPRTRPLAVESLENRALLAVDWVSQGPSPSRNGQVENITDKEVVGAVHTVLAHPTNPNVLYIGATNGGIWKTDNATAASPAWVPLTDAMPSLSIGALSFDPTDSSRQTIVAGIGTYSSWMRLGGSRIGLLRTTDGGAAWSVINGGGTLTGKNISGVAARDATLVVSVNTADSFSTSNLGIFRSTDGGKTFSRISDGGSSGLPSGWSYDLATDPKNDAILYTSIVSTGTGNGVYKSTDTGATWTKVSSAAMDALITSQVSNLEITVGNHNNVYAGIVRNGNPVGFFRSGDGGSSWTQMDAPKTNENGTDVGLNPKGVKGPGPGSDPADIAGGQGTIHFSIVADPDNPNLVYVGGDRQPRSHGDTGSFPNSIGATDYSGRLFRGDASAAAGSQWVHLTHSSSLGAAGGGTAGGSAPHADSRDMTFDAAGNLVEVDDGGVYRRTSPKTNTGNWFSINGSLRVTEMHDVAYDPISNILMSGNQDTGTTEQIVSGGPAWRSVSTGDGGDVSVDSVTLAASGRSIRYSSFQNLGGFRRRVVDATNTVISTSFPALTVNGGGAPLEVQFKTPVALNAINPARMIIVGSNSIYESSDQGASLTEIGPDMGPSFLVSDQDAIAYGGSRNGTANPDVLYVGVADKLRIRTTSSGALVSSDPNPASSATLRDVVMKPSDWTTAFAVDSSRVYRTNDAGATWSDITGNLASLAGGLIRTIEYIPGTIGAIVVGSSLGVFRSLSNSLGTWTEVGTSLPNVPVWDLEYDATDDILVAGTLGRGAWTVSKASDLADDSSPPVLSIAAASANKSEGDSGTTPFTFTVTRSGTTTNPTSVNWSVAGSGSAAASATDFAGGDFPSGSLSFAAGETSKTITVDVSGDPQVEPDEQFTVTLANPVGGTVSTAAAVGTIINDDQATDAELSITADAASRAEGDSGSTLFTFTVTRSGPTAGTTTVNWAVSGSGTNQATNGDFTAGVFPTGSLSFAGGETSKTIVIDVAGDTAIEPDEQFTLTLADAVGGVITTPSASSVILNDDGFVAPELSIAATSASRLEGNSGTTPFTFTVTRSGSTLGTTSVNWAVAGVGANPAAADDFPGGAMPSGTVVFADGESTKVISVNVVGDLSVETDEDFSVTLSDVSGGVIRVATASGTILNDDLAALVSVFVTNANRLEGNSGATAFIFALTRTVSTAGTTVVGWMVRGTGDAPADGADFAGGAYPFGAVTFGVGEVTKFITVSVSGDRDVERDEGFVLQLTDIAGGTIATGSANGTIINDDTGLSIAAAQGSRPEGNTGGSPATAFSFTVTRSGIVTGSSSVRWAVTASGSGSGSASASDFVGGVLPSGSVSFASGESAKTITVNVNGDTTPESNEGFTVTLADAVGGQIVRSTASSTILDDDLLLSITTSTPSQVEGNSGLVPYVFTVTRPTSGTPLVVNWKTEGSGALPTNAADFDGGILPTGSLSFGVGEASKQITVNVAGDTAYEFDERFAVVLFGDLIRSVSASASIVNDDTSLDISRASAVRPEGNSGPTPFTFTVTRAGIVSGTASVSWAVTGTGTNPAADTDFTDGVLPSGTVSFAAGERTKTITVNVAGDSTLEWDEEFTVTLSSPSGGSLGTATATGRIINDESAVRVDTVTQSLKEGNFGATSFAFTVSRLNAAAGVASLSWAVSGSGSDAADGTDFMGGSLPSGTVTFGVGEASKTILVKVNGDTTLEANEGFTVTLSNAVGCEIQTATASATIVSDDTAVAFDVSSASVTLPEGNSATTPFSFTVTRSGAVSEQTSVRWSVFGTGQAAANAADFAASSMPSGQLVFAPGETSKVITLPVIGDLTVERDETFVVLLTDASNARVLSANAKANGTILTDDTGLTLSPASVAATEGNSGVTAYTFTVTRSGFTDTSTTVDWTVAGTSSFPANAADFDGGSLPSGSVTFAAGETSTQITVNVAGDTLAEAEERFTLAIASSGAVLQTATAVGVIRNDDASFSISPTTLARTEGNSGTSQFVFTVTRSGLTSIPASVNWSVAGSGGSPATAADFAGGTLPSGSLTFNPGQTTARITVGVVGDRVAEADESFTVTLADASGASILAGSATATILNDDAPPVAPVASRAANAVVILPLPQAAEPQAAAPRAAAFAQLAQTATPNPYSRPRRGPKRG